jgi:hypothetical protein
MATVLDESLAAPSRPPKRSVGVRTRMITVSQRGEARSARTTFEPTAPVAPTTIAR